MNRFTVTLYFTEASVNSSIVNLFQRKRIDLVITDPKRRFVDQHIYIWITTLRYNTISFIDDKKIVSAVVRVKKHDKI